MTHLKKDRAEWVHVSPYVSFEQYTSLRVNDKLFRSLPSNISMLTSRKASGLVQNVWYAEVTQISSVVLQQYIILAKSQSISKTC